MKKLKSLFCIALLSTCLVGNAFAADTASTGFFGFFSETMNAVVSLLSGSDDCPPRQCTGCKPGNENDPLCRPAN